MYGMDVQEGFMDYKYYVYSDYIPMCCYLHTAQLE